MGTLEEFFEVWAHRQLGIHQKPVVLYNTDGYWDSLLTALASYAQVGISPRRCWIALLWSIPRRRYSTRSCAAKDVSSWRALEPFTSTSTPAASAASSRIRKLECR
ncbi:MAG: LOG family protein [Lawsonella clevelandensis]